MATPITAAVVQPAKKTATTTIANNSITSLSLSMIIFIDRRLTYKVTDLFKKEKKWKMNRKKNRLIRLIQWRQRWHVINTITISQPTNYHENSFKCDWKQECWFKPVGEEHSHTKNTFTENVRMAISLGCVICAFEFGLNTRTYIDTLCNLFALNRITSRLVSAAHKKDKDGKIHEMKTANEKEKARKKA